MGMHKDVFIITMHAICGANFNEGARPYISQLRVCTEKHYNIINPQLLPSCPCSAAPVLLWALSEHNQ